MEFSDFALDERLLRGVAELSFVEPTPIQEDAIPPALEGRDVLGAAMTGSGKTAAYMLPTLHRLLQQPRGTTRALVLTPTRELAQQVEDHITAFAAHTDLTSVVIHGGVAYEPQEKGLRRGVDVVIATPGRLLDHLRRPYARLDGIEVLILDEADRMLDMGFIPDIRKILRHVPEERQTLLFSATMPGPIVALSREVLTDPATINIERKAMPATGITQAVYPVRHELKFALFNQLIEEGGIDSALAFVRTKERADLLANYLEKRGVSVAAIHGDRSQVQRTKALEAFRRGEYQVLVATDVAARGLDLVDLTHVVNIDVPAQPEDYIHRVGRTARYEATGDALTFVAARELADLHLIEKVIGAKIPRLYAEGFDYRPGERREEPAAAKAAGEEPEAEARAARPSRRRRPAAKAVAAEKAETEEEREPEEEASEAAAEAEDGEQKPAKKKSGKKRAPKGKPAKGKAAKKKADEEESREQGASEEDATGEEESEAAAAGGKDRSDDDSKPSRSRRRRSGKGRGASDADDVSEDESVAAASEDSEPVEAEAEPEEIALGPDDPEPEPQPPWVDSGYQPKGKPPPAKPPASAKATRARKPPRPPKRTGKPRAGSVRPWWEAPTRESEDDEAGGAVSAAEAVTAAGEGDLDDLDFEYEQPPRDWYEHPAIEGTIPGRRRDRGSRKKRGKGPPERKAERKADRKTAAGPPAQEKRRDRGGAPERRGRGGGRRERDRDRRPSGEAKKPRPRQRSGGERRDGDRDAGTRRAADRRPAEGLPGRFSELRSRRSLGDRLTSGSPPWPPGFEDERLPAPSGREAAVPSGSGRGRPGRGDRAEPERSRPAAASSRAARPAAARPAAEAPAGPDGAVVRFRELRARRPSDRLVGPLPTAASTAGGGGEERGEAPSRSRRGRGGGRSGRGRRRGGRGRGRS